MARSVSSVYSVLLTMAAIVVLAAACGGARPDPFIRAGRDASTSTATPVTTHGAVNGTELQQGAPQLFARTQGTVRFAQSSDKRVQFQNALAGYIVVWGYDYTVQMIDGESEAHQASILTGKIDVIMEAERGWVETNSEALVNIESSSEQTAKSRVVSRALATEAPELVKFLRTLNVDETTIVSLSEQITTGRIGIKPETVAIGYLKTKEGE